MRTKLLLSMLVFGFSLNGVAAPKSKTKIKKRKFKRTETFKIKNSAEGREKKRFGFNITPMGLTHNALSSSIEGNYFFRKNTIFNVQYSNLISGLGTIDEGKYSSDELEIWKRNGKGMSLSAGAKQFFGNSFYVKGEAYYRNQEHVNFTGSRIKPGTLNTWVVDVKKTGRIEDIGLSLRVGNQWQWDNLTVGVDWVGMNKSVNAISKRGSLEDEDINTFNLLNLYVGASF